jgi:hypothetical protein
VVEGARLESVFRGNSNVGSNPTLSATPLQYDSIWLHTTLASAYLILILLSLYVLSLCIPPQDSITILLSLVVSLVVSGL